MKLPTFKERIAIVAITLVMCTVMMLVTDLIFNKAVDKATIRMIMVTALYILVATPIYKSLK